MDEENQVYFFDHVRLRSLLDALVKGRGSLHWRSVTEARSSGFLVPRTGAQGTPVALTIVGEEAVVSAGLQASYTLTCAEPGGEGQVVEYIAAILDGGATEYGFFNPEEPPQTHLAVSTPTRSSTFDTTDAVLIRRLPAWPAAGRGHADPDR